MQSIALRERLTSWPRPLTPLCQLVERYASRGVVERSDGALQIAPTPWVGTEAFALVLFPPAEPAWILAFEERTGSTIPALYAEFLRATNGCFAFDFSLYGLPPAMQGARPRLDRATLQPLDLDLANRSWIREFRTRPDGLYVGGRSWSDEANCGYFLAADGSIRSALRTGEYRPPALVIWGRHDVYFDVAEAECYRRDLPEAEVHVLDAGHKALETHCAEITELIGDFLARKLAST